MQIRIKMASYSGMHTNIYFSKCSHALSICRIHMLQISLLGSQWRAFRGRKWNPLKQRIDSYDVDGHVSLTRVLSAVVFTLVIFLLPTTTIYYMVFVLVSP